METTGNSTGTDASAGEIAQSLWSSRNAAGLASKIASKYGVYCGPAAVVWIAACWNLNKGRPYPFLERLVDKNLFPDGPRLFKGSLPGFQINLSDLLRRETDGDLQMSNEIYFGYNHIHQALKSSGMPMIVRLPSMSFKNGLHYVTVFKSESLNQMFTFHFQDNGVYRSDVKLVNGLGMMNRRQDALGFFTWGAKQVIRCK